MPSLCLQLEISRNSHPGLPWRDLVAPEPADAKLLVDLDLAPWVIGKRKPRLGDTAFGQDARPEADPTFMSAFETDCETLDLPLHDLPRFAPGTTGRFERVHQTTRREYCRFYEGESKLAGINFALQVHIHDDQRRRSPHSLGREFPEKSR